MKKYISLFVTIALVVGGLYLFRLSLINAKTNARPDEIPIGAILPLSGNQQRTGKFIRQAFDMGIAEINENGATKDRKLKVIYEDDQANPERATIAMQKFADMRDVSVVFGSWASSCVIHGQKDIAQREKIPVLAMAQSPQLTHISDYIFRIQPSSELYTKALVPYVIANQHLTSFHIVHIENDYGKDLAKAFAASCETNNAKVLSATPYKEGDSDFHAIITKLKENTSPHTGVFLAMYSEAGDFLRQAAELGYAPQFVGASPMENPDIIERAGDAANGVIYAHHWNPETKDPRMLHFISSYKARYGEEPEGYAALGYDAAFMLQKVLSTKDGSWPERETVKNALHDVNNFRGVTGVYDIDKNNDVQKPIYIRKIENGKFKTVFIPPAE